MVFEYAFTEVLDGLDVDFEKELILVGRVVNLSDPFISRRLRISLNLSQGNDFPKILRLLPGRCLLNPRLNHFKVLPQLFERQIGISLILIQIN